MSSPSRQPAQRDLDVVLLGATGFTGALTAEYLAENAPSGMRWALAGRNRGKLEAVRTRLATLDATLADLELIEADSADRPSLDAMVARTKVVISTVGPYVQFGEPLVAACAEAGTDYVDITGEPLFVDQMYVAHHATAEKSGARIVHSCGFDSIPHDLGAYYTVKELGAKGPVAVRGVVRVGGHRLGRHLPLGDGHHVPVPGDPRGGQGPAGGRAQGRGPLVEGRRGQAAPRRGARLVAAPVAHHRRDHRGPQRRRAGRRTDRGSPTPTTPAPRSRWNAAAVALGAGALMASAQVPPLKNFLLGRIKQGEGPDEARRAKSWFSVDFVGEGDGRTLHTRVPWRRPGLQRDVEDAC